MEYKNNWPTYVQEKKKKPVRSTVVEPSSEVCVGGINVTEVSKLDIALAVAETNRIKKQQEKSLPLDIVMNKLIVLQRSTNLNLACRARKAACELAGIRKTLAFKCSLLKKKGLDNVIAVENRKALALFKARWESLLEATK